MLSLTAIGIPCNGPRSSPVASAASACSRRLEGPVPIERQKGVEMGLGDRGATQRGLDELDGGEVTGPKTLFRLGNREVGEIGHGSSRIRGTRK